MISKPEGDHNEENDENQTDGLENIQHLRKRKQTQKTFKIEYPFSRIQKPSEQQDLDNMKNLYYLAVLMNYLMQQNKFFGCLQVELYLYYFAIVFFFILMRAPSYPKEVKQTPSNLLEFTSALLPITIVYLIFLVRCISQLNRGMGIKSAFIRLVGIAFYLTFLVNYRL